MVGGDICLECFIFLCLLLGYRISLYYFTQEKGYSLQNSQDSHIWLCRPWPAQECLAKESQWDWNAVAAHLLDVPVQGCSCLKKGVSPAEYFPFASPAPLPTTYLLCALDGWPVWTASLFPTSGHITPVGGMDRSKGEDFLSLGSSPCWVAIHCFSLYWGSQFP